ncbi:PREDICTED: uncharacterized protein LOC105456134 [Wasmannia auropunctata]|uniref:uncharacterized protein LOC105456134 n=1 Tax=Wasmannia auropunctata TaxID=64793 RepID=UPI0005EEB252|nr:PREDICTED: uncharacterized protein LOC105456134 [Wasmannia auropunctata]
MARSIIPLASTTRSAVPPASTVTTSSFVPSASTVTRTRSVVPPDACSAALSTRVSTTAFLTEPSFLTTNQATASPEVARANTHTNIQQRRPRGTRAGAYRQQERFMRFLYQLSSAHNNWGRRRQHPNAKERRPPSRQE